MNSQSNMGKQALIHLHGLFSDIADDYQSRGGRNPRSSEYLEHGTGPTSIHKSKSDHKIAVFKLVEDITSEIEEPGSVDHGYENMFREVVYDAFGEGEMDTSVPLGSTDLNRLQVKYLDKSDMPVEYQPGIEKNELVITDDRIRKWANSITNQLEQ